MRKVIADFVESVRALRVSVVVRDGERHVRIDSDAHQLRSQLLEVHDALVAVDADGALSRGEDPQKYRAGIEGLLRYIQLQGLPIDGALDVLAEHLGTGEVAKKSASYEILPNYSPSHVRKKRTWKPNLTLPKSRLATMTMGDHAKFADGARQVLSKMGAAAPMEDPEPQRASPRM